jgi:hypothetical protein
MTYFLGAFTPLRETVFVTVFLATMAGSPAMADDGVDAELAARGYRLLLDTPYLGTSFSESAFDNLWQAWEEPWRSQAKTASPDERRRLAFTRYGLTPRPDDPRKPMQYVVGSDGNWTMNCLACHQGKVAGKLIPGVPNSLYAMQSLVEDLRLEKFRSGKLPSREDVAGMLIPMGGSNGTTNATMFGVVLMNYRDPQLNYIADRPFPKLVNHDMDAPPWWHYRRRNRLYIDGLAAKSHRALMQFTLVKENGPEKFIEREDDFRAIDAYISSLTPPKYPFEIDAPLAERGRDVFHQTCSRCHGTHGPDGEYTQQWVAIDEVGTSRVRLDSLTPAHRKSYGDSWFNRFGVYPVVTDPVGYIPPPLDGIWATAPYFHNGSVPTLWHVLHPGERPDVWHRSEDGYDPSRVGLEVAELAELPAEAKTGPVRRQYFDTRLFGKSATGHDFAEVLSEEERRAVLEYLKTL